MLARATLPRETLRTFLEATRAATGVPAICAVLRCEGEAECVVVGTSAVDDGAPLPRDVRFEIGCMGKPLVSVVALELAQAGELDLEAPIGEYLPELAGDPKGAAIAAWHLMSHTPGYAGLNMLDERTAAFGWDDLIEHLRRDRQLFAPGTVFNYEQSAGVLLGEIVTRVAGRPVMGLVDDIVLEPLRRRSSPASRAPLASAHAPDAGARRFVRGASRQATSALWRASLSDRALPVEELAALGELLMTGSLPGTSGTRLLSRHTVEALRTRAVALPEVVGNNHSHCMPIGHGRGIAEFCRGVHGCDGTGSGHMVGLRFAPAEGIAIAVAINADAPGVRRTVMASILGELGLAGEPRERSAPLDLAADELPRPLRGIERLGGLGRPERPGDRHYFAVRTSVRSSDGDPRRRGVSPPGRRRAPDGEHRVLPRSCLRRAEPHARRAGVSQDRRGRLRGRPPMAMSSLVSPLPR
ncbi:MAG TPA: serine hydrolase domain-containing protein [Gammaproteobacteria bacterium]